VPASSPPLPVIEHDASLSRADISTGSSLSFNPVIYTLAALNFGPQFITPAQAALARTQRVLLARETASLASQLAGPAANITFFFDDATNELSRAESAFYMLVFLDERAGMTRTDWVNSMFGVFFPRRPDTFPQAKSMVSCGTPSLVLAVAAMDFTNSVHRCV
jgi:hypothetical protein